MERFSEIENSIEEYRKLISQVASGHSFSIINYTCFEVGDIHSDNYEANMSYMQFLEEGERLKFEKNYIRLESKEELRSELYQELREAYEFNLAFSFKNREGKEIENKIASQIEKVIEHILRKYGEIGQVRKYFTDQMNYKITLISMELKRNIHFIEFVKFID
ncbi:MAG: hypothetical protein R2828_26115 [Saprospiraceae bacterium]